MDFSQSGARIFVPDGAERENACARVTHLGIGAHQDDLEFMATHGILACLNNEESWFGGVTCTNGAGSARTGIYSTYSDEEMQKIRAEEQEKAAALADYGVMIQLNHPSNMVKDTGDSLLVDDLRAIFLATRPKIVYTHQPADKHATHIGVMVRTIQAIRALPEEVRPEQIYGCEVWRGLDWLAEDQKIPLDVSGHDGFVEKLNACFDSQITGGKRYDRAVEGRKAANATFYDPHTVDASQKVWYAMNLNPLIDDPELSIAKFVAGHLERFRVDVEGLLRPYL